MESECECCGESTTNYYFGMCAGCIRSLPIKDNRIAELEKAARAVVDYNKGSVIIHKPIDALAALLEDK